MDRTEKILAGVTLVIFTLLGALVGVGGGFYLAKWHECQQGNTTFVCPGD